MTTAANEFMRDIYDWMPIVLGRSDEDAWLDPEALQNLLKPCPSAWLTADEISLLVNSPQSKTPEVLQSVTVTACDLRQLSSLVPVSCYSQAFPVHHVASIRVQFGSRRSLLIGDARSLTQVRRWRLCATGQPA